MPDMEILRDRMNEDYLVSYRNSVTESFQMWHDRIGEVDALIRGEWIVDYPDGSAKQVKPMVMNLADAMPRDVARLATEAAPSVSAPPKSDKKEDIENAFLREAIADTHWEKNRADLYVPQWSMDLVITGTAFAVMWADSQSEYPHILRIDPRFCYPDVVNGVLQDLLVVQRHKLRVLDRLYPDLKLVDRYDGKKQSDVLEEWTYYSKDICIKTVAQMDHGDAPIGPSGTFIVDTWAAGLNCPPVAFAQLPSPDGGFRGLLDQLGTSLQTKNRAIQYFMDNTHQSVYSPWFEMGVLNSEDPAGPRTVYHGDPNSSVPPQMNRVQPAPISPQLVGLLGQMDTEQRGQIAYPATRQGEVPARADSAPFVTATQGQLTSVVRDVQRLLADMREHVTYVTLGLDEKHLPGEKMLARPIGRKKTYKPEKDIAGQYEVSITYGPGAGLDRLNTDVRLMQYYGNSLISAQTALSNSDVVQDPIAELAIREREDQRKIILQRFSGDPTTSLDTLIDALALQDEKGIDLVDALKLLRAQGASTQQPAQPGEQPGALPEGAAPEDQAALQAGAIPEGGQFAQPAPAFAPPPLAQVFVRNR